MTAIFIFVSFTSLIKFKRVPMTYPDRSITMTYPDKSITMTYPDKSICISPETSTELLLRCPSDKKKICGE